MILKGPRANEAVKSALFSVLAFLALASVLQARPLLTEEVATVGRHTFEAGFSLSKRFDDFGSPKSTYETVVFPFHLKLGLFSRFDIGLGLTHIGQRLKVGDTEFTGSANGLLSPQIKFSVTDYVGFLGIWHSAESEHERQDLPIARGNDFETILLLKLPTAWPLHLNAGYLFRESYTSKLGIAAGNEVTVRPADIFESRASLEIPVRYHLSLLTELAYYRVGEKKFGNVAVADSEGDALDSIVGLTWNYKGWLVGGGVGFGLLDESHTSFDLERGAGDILYRVNVAYQLKPKGARL